MTCVFLINDLIVLYTCHGNLLYTHLYNNIIIRTNLSENNFIFVSIFDREYFFVQFYEIKTNTTCQTATGVYHSIT